MTRQRCFYFLASSLLALTLTNAARADLEWTGAVDNELFNEANWIDTDTSMPPAEGSIDPAVDVNNDLVISMGNPTVNAAGFTEPLQLGTGMLTVSGGVLDMIGPAGPNGLRAATPVSGTDPPNSVAVLSGLGEVELQFILDIDMALLDTAVARLAGGGNPINASTIDFQSFDALVHLTAETVEQTTMEHVDNGKFFVFGQPGVLGVNLSVVDDGTGVGSFVTAVPEPTGLALLAWPLLLIARRRQ
jgi:hypothetical protein